MEIWSDVTLLQRLGVPCIHVQLVRGGQLPQSVSQFMPVASAAEAVLRIEQRTRQLVLDEALADLVQSDEAVRDSRCLTIGFRTGAWPAQRCITFTLVAPTPLLLEVMYLARARFGGMHAVLPEILAIDPVASPASATSPVSASAAVERSPVVDSVSTQESRAGSIVCASPKPEPEPEPEPKPNPEPEPEPEPEPGEAPAATPRFNSTPEPAVVDPQELKPPIPEAKESAVDEDALFDEFEVAPTGRSHCQVCRGTIARG
jgi:hypothetical protein